MSLNLVFIHTNKGKGDNFRHACYNSAVINGKRDLKLVAVADTFEIMNEKWVEFFRAHPIKCMEELRG